MAAVMRNPFTMHSANSTAMKSRKARPIAVITCSRLMIRVMIRMPIVTIPNIKTADIHVLIVAISPTAKKRSLPVGKLLNKELGGFEDFPCLLEFLQLPFGLLELLFFLG